MKFRVWRLPIRKPEERFVKNTQWLSSCFCLDHTCNCCAKCVSQGHRECDERLLPLDQGYASCLEEIITDASALAKQYEKQMEKINEQSKVIPGQIESMKECVIKLFDELRSRVTGSLNDKENELKEEIKPKRKFCNDTKGDIDMTSSILKGTGTITSSNELLPILASKLQSYRNSIAEQKMLNFDVEMSIKFKDSVETLTNTRSIGEIKISKRYPQKKINLRKIEGRVLAKSPNDDSEPRYCKLEFVNDMQIVAIDSMNRKVVLFSSNLAIQSSIMLNNCIPVSLAVISKGIAAVTSISDKIDILQISGNNTITLNQPLNVSSQYSSATKMNDETMCCIAKGDNRSMRMVSLNGKEADFVPRLPERAYKLGEAEIAFLKNQPNISDNRKV
ncbi:hypothetical protein DPMN_045343 [Dreissena polymorpha]|uniref:Uncharacterized protein n=1 Tax=Dreissena polymorpha TaxID=45954 RepID=A0A9D4D478_DREPO|nr:hypothetical protein DPMN_045343 [Dreissena polymorpha]